MARVIGVFISTILNLRVLSGVKVVFNGGKNYSKLFRVTNVRRQQTEITVMISASED